MRFVLVYGQCESYAAFPLAAVMFTANLFAHLSKIYLIKYTFLLAVFYVLFSF